MKDEAPDARIERLLRELTPQVVAAVVRRFHDFGASEDAVQEALLAAAGQWPCDGVPDDPRAWLIHVAARRLTDQVRSAAARRRRESLVVSLVPLEDQIAFAPDEEGANQQDDTLALLFLCCHPALSPSSAIALTLRAVGGLTTAEIAKAFLVPEATMAQRISRAKQSIKASGVGFELPSHEEVEGRTRSVLHVLYLIFNEGYASSSGLELRRTDLSDEAIRLTRMLKALRPGDMEVTGLLGLLLLTDARKEARTGPSGELIPLAEQDRSRWDRTLIAEGLALLGDALEAGLDGTYQLQAAIAALHDEAETVDSTDWEQIRRLYFLLMKRSDNPMVALNHAVAVAMVEGAEAGLALLRELDGDPRMKEGHRLDAVRAHLLERAGDVLGAAELYRRAADRTTSIPERNYLMTQAARTRDAAG